MLSAMHTLPDARRLKRAYLFTLALVTAFAFIAFLTIRAYDGAQANTTSALSLNARERALTQRIAWLALRLRMTLDSSEQQALQQQLRATTDSMQLTHGALLHAFSSVRLFNLPSPAIQGTLFEPTNLDHQARDYIAHANSLLSSANDQFTLNSDDFAFVENYALIDLPNAFDALNDALQVENNAMLAGVTFFELIVLVVIMLTLGAQPFFVLRPLQRRIDDHTRQLDESQKQLDAVLGTVGEAIVTVDSDNRIVRVNQEVSPVWGYASDKLLGEPLETLLAPAHRERYSQTGDWRTLGKRQEIEGLRQNGDVFPLEIRFSKVLANGATLYAAAMRDISERKRAEEQIRHQLETIQALYVSSQQLAESLDLSTLAGDITRTCVEEFGASRAWLGRARADGSIQPFAHYPPIEYPPKAIARWDNPDVREGAGPHGIAIRTGEPVVVEDIASEERFLPWRDVSIQHGIRCMAVFPLISRNHAFGVLSMHSTESGFFTAERMGFFQSYAHQAAAALENARLFAEDRRRLEQMQALRNVDTAITSSLDLRVTLNVLLDQIIQHLSVDATAVLLLNAQTQLLEHAAHRGFRYDHIGRTRVRLGKGLAGRAALDRAIVSVPNFHEADDDPQRAPLLAGEGYVSYVAVPLHAKGQVKGVLEIVNRAPLQPDPEWFNFLEALAAQAAIAIDNAALFDGLQRSNLELALAYDDTLQGWSTALELRDRETEGHTVRVTALAVQLARELGLGNDELVQVHHGSLLHDIGKMAVPDYVLLKEGPLDEDEWRIMRRHPAYAFEMLSPIAYLRPALDIPYCHHERLDGTGYPRGLKGEEIPLSARIFAVVDVWDALLSDRPYRKAWSAARARAYLKSLSGAHFDPHIVEVFLQTLDDEACKRNELPLEPLLSLTT